MESRPAQSDAANIRRFVPDEPLPPYSYVTGRFPHPLRDPAGHSFGVVPAPCPAPDPNRWHDSRAYLFGVDLFNSGFYWEAHETWEGLWHACGRGGVTGDFIKGLIKLAAAGVKAREGRPEGVQRHGRRAAELFRLTAECVAPQSHYFGLSLPWLIETATNLANGSITLRPATTAPVEVIFPFILEPAEV